MRRKRLASTALALCVLAPLVAGAAGAFTPAVATPAPQADEAEPDANYVFGLLDRNGDDRIDAAEAKASAPLVRYFRELDTDGDGNISRAEWGSYFQPGARA